MQVLLLYIQIKLPIRLLILARILRKAPQNGTLYEEVMSHKGESEKFKYLASQRVYNTVLNKKTHLHVVVIFDNEGVVI